LARPIWQIEAMFAFAVSTSIAVKFMALAEAGLT
jgi:hypothetical protein